MKRRIAATLFTLLVAGAASAVSSFTPTLGAPVQITVGQTIDIEMRLGTTDLVGAVNAIFEATGGLTINSCTAIEIDGNQINCNDLTGGKWQGTGSDFDDNGILDLDALLSINVTGITVGGAVTLLTFAGDNSNFTLCPTNLFDCFIAFPSNEELTAFSNEGSVLVKVVPEPGTAALFAFGLLGLGVRRRAARAC